MAKPRKGVEPPALRRWRLSHRRKRTVHHKRTKVTHMSRRRYGSRRHRGGGKKGIRIAATVGMVAGLYALYKSMTGEAKASGKYGQYMLYRLTGYDTISTTHAWRPTEATAGIPMLGGAAISMVASKTGLNRYTPKYFKI